MPVRLVQVALSALPLAVWLAGCAPGGDVAGGDSTTVGEVNATNLTSTGQEPSIMNCTFERDAKDPSRNLDSDCAINYRCTDSRGCKVKAMVAIDSAQVLLNATQLPVGNDRVQAVVALDIYRDSTSKIGETTHFGVREGVTADRSLLATNVAGTYGFLFQRPAGLPSPDFDRVTFRVCVGDANADCMFSGGELPFSVKVSGRVVIPVTTNYDTGAYDLQPVADREIELVDKGGASLAARFRMTTDVLGGFTADAVAPGEYAMRIGAELFPIRVSAHSRDQQVDDILIRR